MPVLIKKAGFENLLTSGDYYLKVMIIGEVGSGKTPFAAQFDRPLFAMTENGHMSLALSGSAYADIKSTTDMQAVLDMARLESRKPAASRTYNTLVIDTIDSYQKIAIQERLKETRGEALSGWADWGWLDGKMTALTEQLKELAMHVVVLMHTKDVQEQVSEDSEATRIVQRARMKGDIKESIYDNFPLIGLMENYYTAGSGEEKGKRILARRVRWHADPKHPVLRDQSTRLPQFTDVLFQPSDFQQLLDSIGGGMDALPSTEVLGELETPEVDEAPLADVPEVGALDKPALPRAAAAKKAVAKKTAAKKATPAKKAEATPVENSSPAPVVATDPEPSPSVDASAGDGGAQESAGEDIWAPPKEDAALPAEDLLDQLGATEISNEPVKAAPGQKICGTQPANFVGKYEPAKSCGRPIAADDTRSKVAVVKFRTFLCGDCFDLNTNN